MTQNSLILNHLRKHGYITPLVAQSYGVQRLAARIDELRKDGHAINRELRRNDVGVRYAYYTLTEAS